MSRMLLASVFAILLVSAGAAVPALAEGPETIAGAVSEVDVVGKSIELRVDEASGKSERVWFRIEEATEIRAGGREASISDLRPGESVTVTYFPAKLPRTAERIEIR